MKNLKKILIALVVLAVLVSSVVVMVVTADDQTQYTGTLEAAQALLDEATSVEGESFVKREAAIKAVYSYLAGNPVDPETEGYAEFAATLDTKALVLANDYYNRVATKTTATEKADSVKLVLDYLAACPIDPATEDPDGDGKYVSFAVLAQQIEQTKFDVLVAFYGEVDAAYVALDRTLAINTLAALYTFAAECPVDSSIEGYADLYRNYNNYSVTISSDITAELVDGKANLESAEYRTLINTNLSALVAHMAAAPVDVESFPEFVPVLEEIEASIDVAEFDQILFLFSDYEAVPDEADGTYTHPALAKQTLLTKTAMALANSSIPEDLEGYAELVAKIAEEQTKLDEAEAAREKVLDDNSNLADFEYTANTVINNFSADGSVWGSPNKSADAYGEIVKPAGSGVSGYEGYMRYVYGASPSHCYSTMAVKDTVNGFTIQLDVKLEGTNGENFKTSTYSFRHYGKDSSNKQYSGTFYNLFGFSYDKNTDSIKAYNYKTDAYEATTVYYAAAEGEWFNIIITMDPITRYGKFYLNYEYLFDIYFGPAAPEVTVGEIRGNGDKPKYAMVSYDNYRFYEGTSYRVLDKFDGMSDNEKFDFYVNYFLDGTKAPKGRNVAYMYSKRLIDGIKAQYEGTPDEEMTDDQKHLKELVLAMEAFDYHNEVVVYVRAENLEQIKTLTNKVLAINITSETISKINKAIEALDTYIVNNNDFIDKADPEYNAAMQQINTVKEGIVKCQNAVTFAKALKQFQRATSLASMSKRYAAAEEVYKLARYDRAANREFVANDPAILAFELIINGKEITAEDPAYVTAFEYYDSLVAVMAEQAKVENSDRIIDCIALVLAMKDYEDTEEYWVANYDELEFYIGIIRDIVSADNYDPTFKGVDAAIAKYEIIDEFFYELLQEEHIAIIGAQLDRFPVSDSYIEKVGICTYLDRYFAENNDINLDLPEIQAFLYRLEQYKAELDVQIEDYKDLLEQNTRYFIDTVNKMKALSTYAELKPLYDVALSYYYGMNVGSEEANAAIASFNYYEDKLESIEVNSKLFENAAVNLKFATGAAAIYEVLAECVQYYEYTDATYSSKVATAMQTYEAKVAEYNSQVETINAEIELATQIVASLRADQVPVAILAIVNEYYESN